MVSFRSVPRILRVLDGSDFLSCHWIPHFSSVINWIQRIGLSLLNQVSVISEPWVAIIDHSIDIGVKKAFVVLRVPLATLSSRDEALKLADCECIGLRIIEQCDGQQVCHDLTEIFEQSGNPSAIIKDGAGNLACGVEQWKQETANTGVEVIADIGHMMANALKAQFNDTFSFNLFLDTIRAGAHKLRQTALAFLIPPKIRTKGRFQGIGRLAQWADMMLNAMKQRGKAKAGSALQKLRDALPELVQQQPFIERFALHIKLAHEILKVLKNRGLSDNSAKEVKGLANAFPAHSKVRKKFFQWLDDHEKVAERLEDDVPLIVSSDIIECLLGRFKSVLERSPIADMNRMALIIPTFCGPRQQLADHIPHLLSGTQHRDLLRWERESISHTLRKKRRAFKDNPSIDCLNAQVPNMG
jgi:hypothetical protein